MTFRKTWQNIGIMDPSVSKIRQLSLRFLHSCVKKRVISNIALNELLYRKLTFLYRGVSQVVNSNGFRFGFSRRVAESAKMEKLYDKRKTTVLVSVYGLYVSFVFVLFFFFLLSPRSFRLLLQHMPASIAVYISFFAPNPTD